MRLGGPVKGGYGSSEEWLKQLRDAGYSAAYCPVGIDAAGATVREYEEAAKKADVVIAECGAWSNPISSDAKERGEAIEKCRRNLALADEIGAKCCVNVTGSRGESWAGPDAKNLTRETFDMIVSSVREIVDAVKPKRTFYALETMPWMYPDSPDCYLELLEAIDRKSVAVHLDPVNLICSPQRYFDNANLIRECFRKLGPRIKSCHGKDVILRGKLTVHLDECRPGTGGLDYHTFLSELKKLGGDVPLMLEHLPDDGEYRLAAEYVRSVDGSGK